MTRRVICISVLVVTAVLLGLLYLHLYLPQRRALDAARREASLLSQEMAALRNRVADQEQLLEELKESSAELESAVASRQEEIERLRWAQEGLATQLKEEISAGQVRVEQLRDRLRVEMVDRVLFDSGEATLKPSGAEVLRKVGTILKQAEDRQVIVQGHTDDVPIRGGLARTYPTNWELSAARAVNVVRFLHEELDLDPARLTAEALSQYRPRADNSTTEGRAENRRIEIVLAPLDETE